MTTVTRNPIGDPERLAEFLDPVHEGPELDEILDLKKNALTTYFDEFHRIVDEDRRYSRDDFDVPVAESGQEIHTGMGHDLIEDAVNHIDPEHIQIEVPPRGNRGHAQAEKMAKWLRGAWHRLQQEDGPVVRQWIRDTTEHDVGVLKVLFAPDRWPDRPEVPEEGESKQEYLDEIDRIEDDRAIVWPFVAENVDLTSLVWDTSKTGPHWFIQSYDMSIIEIKSRFPDWESGGMGDGDQFIEYWDDEWVAYIAGGTFAMEPRRHGYPLHAFRMAEGGQGNLSSLDPKYRYVGMLRYKHGLLDEEARLFSQLDTLVRQYSWPSRTFQGDEDVVDRVMKEWDNAPGVNNFLPEGVTQTWDIPPGVPNDLFVVRGEVVGAIERGTLPRVASGASEPNLRSGNTVAIRAGLARLKLDPIAGGVARGIQQANALLLGLVEEVALEGVTVWGDTSISRFTETLGPNDIKGHRATIVRLSASAPEDQSQRLADAINGKQAGIYSQLFAKKLAGVLNPLEDEEQRIAELMLTSPQFLEGMIALAAQNAGFTTQLGIAAGQNPTASVTQPGQLAANPGQFAGGQAAAGARGSEQQIQSNQRRIPNSLPSLDNMANNAGPLFGGP